MPSQAIHDDTLHRRRQHADKHSWALGILSLEFKLLVTTQSQITQSSEVPQGLAQGETQRHKKCFILAATRRRWEWGHNKVDSSQLYCQHAPQAPAVIDELLPGHLTPRTSVQCKCRHPSSDGFPQVRWSGLTTTLLID